MTIRGWLASSYYARTRNSALLAAMLCLACAVASAAASSAKKPARAKANLRGGVAERLEAADAARFRRGKVPASAELDTAIAREGNPQVRYSLLRALAASDPAAAGPVLSRSLRADSSVIVRVAAAQELGRLDAPASTRALAAALAGDAPRDPLLSPPERPEFERRLTPRERDVFLLMVRGLGTATIADRLVIRPGTVKDHIKSILRKIGASNRAEAIGMTYGYDFDRP